MPQHLLDRPDVLPSTTYKVRSAALDDHALFITITNRVVNGQERPFELFLQSKHKGSYEYLPVLGRLISSILRHEGPFPRYLVDELINSWGEAGYIIPGTTLYCGGVVSHVGHVLQEHCVRLGLIEAQGDNDGDLSREP